ncbi:MAG: hypothetical protein H6817_03765 [Phycisphaerales bacterium]|nr:hypothetical protein [Phycisphaerales bacterium]
MVQPARATRLLDVFETIIPPLDDDTRSPLNWWNVIILVNDDSPAGLEVVKLYRQYHPRIRDGQIVHLSGLPDCASANATPADEIITREQFENLIAAPTRAHLINEGLSDLVYVIITTAGMPYRIEDTDSTLGAVIQPAGSYGQLVVNKRNVVDAASVESELAVLFQIDPALPAGTRLPIDNRLVNPYHGYVSSIKRWAEDRSVLSRRNGFAWQTMWHVGLSPLIEGDYSTAGWSAKNRRMSPADIYLVARLDGPREQGKLPIFAVRDMLQRAARVSDTTRADFVGYDPARAVVAIDHSPLPPAPAVFSSSAIYNFPMQVAYMTYDDHPVPPGAEEISGLNAANHYFVLFDWLTGFPATVGGTGSRTIVDSLGGVALWDDSASILNSSFIPLNDGIIGLMTYGRNGGDGRPPTYLLTGGQNGGPLFRCAPGAVFTSLESFNAVTMFDDASSNQAKIVEFIRMGGTAAVGHSFEPELSAEINVEFLYSNLLRDADHDGAADMTVAEAAFTAMPYLSWTEVLIGDPLMRLQVGPGAIVDTNTYPGDTDGNHAVNYADLVFVLTHYGSVIGDGAYSMAADLTEDGVIDDDDLLEVIDYYGVQY